LGLLKEGRLTNAGLLLFGTRPQEHFIQAQLRIGVFRSPTEIVDTHEFRGTLWEQLDGAMERFRRLLKVRFQERRKSRNKGANGSKTSQTAYERNLKKTTPEATWQRLGTNWAKWSMN